MNDDYKLYILAELNYKDEHKEEINDLFPNNWYNSNDYKLKTNIIGEALLNNIKIEDTPMYKEALKNNMFE